MQSTHKMNEQSEQIVNYIKQSLAQGVPEESIHQALLQNRWDPELINWALAFVKSPTPNYQPPAQLGGSQTQSPQNIPPPATQPMPSTPAQGKYRVFRSLMDTIHAIANNAATYFLALAVSYAVAVVTLLLVTLIIKKVLVGEFGLLFASTPKLLTVLFGSLILYTLWHAFGGTLVMNTTALALYDGADGRKSSIGATIGTSFKRIGRVIMANVLFTLLTIWPIVLIFFLPIILFTGGVDPGTSLLLGFILMLVSLVWAYIALIRFALAPYIALFEPEIPVTKTLARSKRLLIKGGQWFLVKGILLLIACSVVVALTTGQDILELTDSSTIVGNLLYVIVSILANGSLVMLYRNRRAIRN